MYKWKNLKYIYPVIPDKSQSTASLFLVHIPRGFAQENVFPKLSIYVRHKLNTVWKLARNF